MLPIDNFFRAAARWPNRLAVEISTEKEQRKISYQDLANQVNALAVALQAIDPAPQTCVGICAYNSFEHLLGWLATFAAGKVWVPLNPRNGRSELDRIIDLTAPSIIIFDADCDEKFGTVSTHLHHANVMAVVFPLPRANLHNAVDATIRRQRSICFRP